MPSGFIVSNANSALDSIHGPVLRSGRLDKSVCVARSRGSEVSGRKVLQAAVRAIGVVLVPPRIQDLLGILERERVVVR